MAGFVIKPAEKIVKVLRVLNPRIFERLFHHIPKTVIRQLASTTAQHIKSRRHQFPPVQFVQAWIQFPASQVPAGPKHHQ